MAVPTDFPSFAGGWNLTSANYSGGAAGTFANLISGEATLQAQQTPSFVTEEGMEGVAMDGATTVLASLPVNYPYAPVCWECTLLVIARPNSSGRLQYCFGGTNDAANSWGITVYTNQIQAFNGLDSSGYTAAVATATTRPHVYTVGFCPRPDVGQTWARIDDGTIKFGPQTTDSYERARITTPIVAVGEHRATAFDGWVGRALLFTRDLYRDDPAGLDSLIATEMASIGL